MLAPGHSASEGGAEPFPASPPRQAHEYVDKQHITSNLTVRVSHDLLRAGARCRVSNTLGVTEQHIQLLGECWALPSEPRVLCVCAVLVWCG